MHCSICKHINSADVLFCGQCGSRLDQQTQAELCAVCAALLLPDSKFCGQCGSQRNVSQNCRSCGHRILAGSRFCGECGTPVVAAQTAAANPAIAEDQREDNPDLFSALMPKGLAAKIRSQAGLIVGERREVTVLFVAITGFNGANQRWDSEDIYLV